MISMNVRFIGRQDTPAWPELDGEDVIHLGNGAPPIQLVVVERGLVSGRPSVAMRIDLPDQKSVVVETTARLLVVAARVIEARYPELMRDDA